MPFLAELLAHCDRSERRRIQIARRLSANNVTRGTHLTGEALTTPGICGEPRTCCRTTSSSTTKAAIRTERLTVIGAVSGSRALAMNVVLKFIDNEFLFGNYTLEQIADGDNADHFFAFEHGQVTHTLVGHQGHA